MNILQYPFITPYTYAASFYSNSNPVQEWLIYGKIAENPIVTPSSSVQVIIPSAENKYLESVTVEATTTSA